AELDAERVLEGAARALALQRCATLAAKPYTAGVFDAAGWQRMDGPVGPSAPIDPRATQVQATGARTAPPNFIRKKRSSNRSCRISSNQLSTARADRRSRKTRTGSRRVRNATRPPQCCRCEGLRVRRKLANERLRPCGCRWPSNEPEAARQNSRESLPRGTCRSRF